VSHLSKQMPSTSALHDAAPPRAMLPPGRMSEPASLALASFANELARLCPPGATVLDAHTHLGLDEDRQSLDFDSLLAHLDQVSPGAQACAFPFDDPDRQPRFRRPNDRVLAWARESARRIIPSAPPPA
jgi:hypothetical protein